MTNTWLHPSVRQALHALRPIALDSRKPAHRTVKNGLLRAALTLFVLLVLSVAAKAQAPIAVCCPSAGDTVLATKDVVVLTDPSYPDCPLTVTFRRYRCQGPPIVNSVMIEKIEWAPNGCCYDFWSNFDPDLLVKHAAALMISLNPVGTGGPAFPVPPGTAVRVMIKGCWKEVSGVGSMGYEYCSITDPCCWADGLTGNNSTILPGTGIPICTPPCFQVCK